MCMCKDARKRESYLDVSVSRLALGNWVVNVRLALTFTVKD